ncbi:DUF4139 domain-containing protein [Roseovarius sp. D22-M7]|uniref:DUF4139 domain-containing protein n=1 Tax=Roseovarius sp. D22-M7 TaxID=3127116 RepID=UPI0030102ED3
MRSLVLPLLICAGPAVSEDIALSSRVTAVTLYPDGATVTREVPFTAPAGEHELILADLPRGTPLASARVTLDGARMGGITTRTDYVPPRDIAENPELQAARAEVTRLEDALRDARAEVEDIRLQAEAARARAAFLDRIGGDDGMSALGVEDLRALVEMIGAESLAALQDAAEATRRADAAERGLEDQVEALKDARQAVEALVPEEMERAMLSVAVTAQSRIDGRMTVTYTISDAGWQPLYDLHLARATGTLRIERGAFVQQSTGENWRDVALTLSTLRPSGQTEPGRIRPWIPRIGDPDDIRPMNAEGAAPRLSRAVPMADSAEVATSRFDGLSVTYDYPSPVDVASGADRVRLMLGTIEAEADIAAKAVPLVDETAYVAARFTNDTREVLLPTPEARFFLDGTFVGQRELALIAAGAEAELAFGRIEGIRLSRQVQDRGEGDQGLIRRSSRLGETVLIEVENLTDEDWPLRLIDRVPVSEQDALAITWQADPAPDQQDVDGERGILRWEMDLPAGETRTIRLSTELTWPEDKVLRR